MGPDQTDLHFKTLVMEILLLVMEILLILPFETTTGVIVNKKISINGIGIANKNFLGIQKNRKNSIKNKEKSSGRAARTIRI